MKRWWPKKIESLANRWRERKKLEKNEFGLRINGNERDRLFMNEKVVE